MNPAVSFLNLAFQAATAAPPEPAAALVSHLTVSQGSWEKARRGRWEGEVGAV